MYTKLNLYLFFFISLLIQKKGLGVLGHIHPPVRPVRHVQYAAQHWAETKTTKAPGLIVRSTAATVSQQKE